MVRDPLADEDQPELQDVLDALDDPDCRTIVSVLEESMTASEIAEESDIPLSTTYRKIERLTEAALPSPPGVSAAFPSPASRSSSRAH